MNLKDILEEKRQIPDSERVSIETLKEYMFKDWQIFNEKIVPAFRHLRNKVMKETYGRQMSSNNFYNVVNFAAKKYVAECTNRKYHWNEVFSTKDRYALTNSLCEYFEKHNLNEESQLINEQEGGTKQAKITFSEIEVELKNDTPIFVINMNYDEGTQNYITNSIGKGYSVNIMPNDLQIMQSLLKVQIKDATSGQGLAYLKFVISSTSISREDIKVLMSGAFMNRPVTLQVVQSNVQTPEVEPTEPEAQEPVSTEPTEPVSKEPVINKQQAVRGRQKFSPRITPGQGEIREAVNDSIKKLWRTK